MSKRWLDIELNRARSKLTGLRKQRNNILLALNKLDERIEEQENTLDRIDEAAKAFQSTIEREANARVNKLQYEIKQLKKNPVQEVEVSQKDEVAIAKASSISIFDSIIFAISNWSTDGQTAPDVELACQSILFPVVYEKIMRGNEDYYITRVPVSALEVVRRGREYVQHLRAECDVLISTDSAWKAHAADLQNWWINDALPLLYGARDEDWNISTSLQLAEVIEWRDMPASRALHFPLIWDGMELVKKYADDIRESTGLPEFTKQTLSTRIEP